MNRQRLWKSGVWMLYTTLILLNGWLVYKVAFIRQWPDFGVYLEAGRRLWAVQNPYILTVHDQFWYPLFFAAVMIPFAALPLLVSHYLWYAISVTSLFIVLRETCRILGVNEDKQHILWICVGLIFVSIIQADWMYGNVNLFLLAMLMQCIRQRQTIYRAAILIGTAISVKFAPIVMILFLAFDNQHGHKLWRNLAPLALLFATVGLLCVGLPYLIAGTAVFDFYHFWWYDLMIGQIRNQPSANNFTLAGGLAYITLDLYPAPLWLQLACGLFLASFVAYLSYKGKREFAFILCLIIMPLTGARGQQHHLIVLIPAYILMLNVVFYHTFLRLGSQTITLTRSKRIALFSFLLGVMLCILWGNHAPKKFPLDMLGLFAAFCTTFFVMLSQYPRVEKIQS